MIRFVCSYNLPICDMFPSGPRFEICHRPYAVCRVERRRGGLRAELPGYALRALKRRGHQHTERTVCSVIRANMANEGVLPLLEKSIFCTPWCLLSCACVPPVCHSFSFNTPSSHGRRSCLICSLYNGQKLEVTSCRNLSSQSLLTILGHGGNHTAQAHSLCLDISRV